MEMERRAVEQGGYDSDLEREEEAAMAMLPPAPVQEERDTQEVRGSERCRARGEVRGRVQGHDAPYPVQGEGNTQEVRG